MATMSELEGNIVLISETTETVATLYENGCTLHSSLGLGIDDKDSSEATAFDSFIYGLHLDLIEVLLKDALIIVNEASMLHKRLFEIVHVALEVL